MTMTHWRSHPHARGTGSKATVDIHDAVAGVLSVLEIDAPLGNDVASAVESTLFELRVQVVRVHSRTARRRTVHEYEVVEFDGAPLRLGRQREVQTALVSRLRESWTPDPR